MDRGSLEGNSPQGSTELDTNEAISQQQHVVNRCTVIYTDVSLIKQRQSRFSILLKGSRMFKVANEHWLQLQP